jgi:polysaccharide chain length determinant protein (PEP-CTERM system associated)
MPLRANMELNDFLEIFLQRKWQIIFSVLIVLFAGIVYCVVIPNQYRSSTTILIVPQRVPEKFVSSTVTYGVEERLAATSRQILSRTRLLEVVDELGLFPEERETVPPEIMAEMMRDRIGIDIIRGQDAFVLSFEHEDPQIAMSTASRLASFFIEENLRTREQLAAGTSEFLDTQLEQVKKRLEEQEEKVKRYKLQHMGELPEEMQANLSMLTRLQDQRRTTAEAIAKAQDRKLFMETQISNMQNQIRTIEGGGEDPSDLLIDELLAKRKQLEDLSAKYTPNYPTIIELRRSIEQLERRIASGETGRTGMDNTQKSGPPLRTRKATREREEVWRLKEQVKSLDLEILALKREQSEIQRASETIQSKVSRLPQREQEMISLTRDYDNLRESYDDLLRKKLQAKVSQNLEERQKGETFQVVDPANLPVFPFKPKRKKILGLSLIAALAFGFGGALGLELLDPTLRRPSDFKQFFDLPVLATIPMIQDAQYARRSVLRRAALIGGIVSFMCAVIAFVFLYSDRIMTIIQF